VKTILLVDGDVGFLAECAELLSAPDRLVLTERDGYEALRVLVEKPIDLLITDVKMPWITGFALAHLAKLVRQNLCVIYAASNHCEGGNVGDLAYGPILRKPFRTGELLEAVNAVSSFNKPRSRRVKAPFCYDPGILGQRG
jgi:DNA-binding response OmpR family regulator